MRSSLFLAAALLFTCGRAQTPAPLESPREGTTDALRLACGFDAEGGPRAVLAGWSEEEVFLVRSDGTRKSLIRRPSAASSWLSLPLIAGRYVAVTSTALVGQAYENQVALFDDQGNWLASAEGASASVVSAQGAAAGWHAKGMAILRRDGATAIKEGFSPAGAFGKNGLLPVHIAGSNAQRLALYDVESDAVVELPVQANGGSQALWAGDVLVYLSEQNGVPVLVRHAGSQTATTVIDDLGVIGASEIESVSDTEAVLTAGSWVQKRFTLNLATGVLTPFQAQLPTGYSWAGSRQTQLSGGRLVTALGTEGAVGLFDSADGKAWSALGAKVDNAVSGRFVGRGGSWILSATGKVLSMQTTLGLRPANDRSLVLPALSVGTDLAEESISDDGRCVAVWTPGDRSDVLTVVDLVGGVQVRLLELPRTGERPPAHASWLSTR